MCKSAAEGGQRCASHTRPAYHQATPGTHEWDAAAASYGSTRSGRIELKAYKAAAEVRGDVLTATAYNHALNEGMRHREKTAAYLLAATTGQEAHLPPADPPSNWNGNQWTDPDDGTTHDAEPITAYFYNRDTGRDYRLIALYNDHATMPDRDKQNVPEGTLYRYDEWGRCALYAPIVDTPAAPTSAPAPMAPTAPTAPTAPNAVVSDAPEQVRYRELFERRNNLKDSIYAKEQTVEDAADAHEIGELDAELAAVEAEMESLETWRR